MPDINVNPKPVVYIAGPFSNDPWPNTVTASKVWRKLYLEDEVIPICPHWSWVQEEVERNMVEDDEMDEAGPCEWDDWMTYDLELINMTCDAILRLPGESAGADMEVEFAQQLGMPVFFYPEDGNLAALYEWAEFKREACSND